MFSNLYLHVCYHFILCFSTMKAQEASMHLLFSLSVLLSIPNIIKQCKLRQWWRWNYSNVVCIAQPHATGPYWWHSSSLPIERWLPRLETTSIKQILGNILTVTPRISITTILPNPTSTIFRWYLLQDPIHELNTIHGTLLYSTWHVSIFIMILQSAAHVFEKCFENVACFEN